MALATFLVCGALFTLGWIGIRVFVDARLSIQASSQADGQLTRLVDALTAGRPPALDGDPMFVVLDAAGRVVTTSDAITRLRPQWTPPPPAPAGARPDWNTETEVTLSSAEHPQWREFRTYTVLGRVAGPLTAYVFVLPWDTQSTLRLFDDTMAFFVPVATLIAVVVAWLSLGRALRSVEAIRQELAEVSGSRLDRRVPVPPSRDEIAKLASTTNETLDRLQRSHEQQERLVGDASHELRSPLTSLRTGLEVALAHRERANWPAVVQRSLLDVDRLQRITADLLQLAVQDRPVSTEVIDLVDVAVEQVYEENMLGLRDVRAVADGPALVRGDLLQLERLLSNLIGNAMRHCVRHVTVTVTVSSAEEQVVLEVLDDGPGIPVGERERVFARFVRLDDARARDAGGSGLGLTLARDIAVRHGGTLTVEDSDVGARFVLRLPGVRDEGGLP
jgi:signal transduction histidine kinase